MSSRRSYPPSDPPFRANVSAKPLSIDTLGTVTFVDRLDNEVTPNESLCNAYGYKFDRGTGTCKAFQPTTSIETSLRTEDNLISGQSNVVGQGTTNSYILGSDNTIEGNSRNNIIVGNNNNIVEAVDNANVFGTLGEATANNSIVLGGNAAADNLGERQTMTIMYGCQTTNNSTVDAFLNNTTDSYFVVPENTVIYFQSETLAVRVGGSSGSGAVGDFKAWVERGVVKNAAGTLSIDRSRTSPADSGTTTGWSPINSVSGTNFLQTVKGATDMTLEWASTIRITQIKTGVTLS
tara:strand:+ start:1935 stop:2813 length:879 start_codon:yes stop_codon:yes gene_type:complete